MFDAGRLNKISNTLDELDNDIDSLELGLSQLIERQENRNANKSRMRKLLAATLICVIILLSVLLISY